MKTMASIAFAAVVLCGPGPSAQGQTYSFFEDFETQGLSRWTVECGTWTLATGFGGGQAARSGGGNCALVHQTFSASYGRYHYDFRFPAGADVDDADLLFQRNGTACLWLQLGPIGGDNTEDRITRVSGQASSVIGCAPKAIADTLWHQVDIYCYANNMIEVYVDDLNRIAPAAMRTFDAGVAGPGTVAIRAFGRVTFDNVAYTAELPSAPAIGPVPACAALGPYSCDGTGGGGGGGGGNTVPAFTPWALLVLAAMIAARGMRMEPAARQRPPGP